jgi:hypothetical protein
VLKNFPIFASISTWMRSICDTLNGVKVDSMKLLGIKGFKVLSQVVILVDEFLKFEAESEMFIDELETHINTVEEMISTSKLDMIVRLFF